MTKKQQRTGAKVNFLKVYRYCPKCGGPMKAKIQSESIMPTCQNGKCGYIFWQTSSPCVVTIIQNELGHVLMTERGIEPDKGKLDLPGGFMKRGEDPAEAARRETREEIGVEVEIIDFVGFEIDDYYYQAIWEKTLTVGFTARIIKGKPRRADTKEIARITWVNPNDFDSKDLAFSGNEKYLRRVRKALAE